MDCYINGTKVSLTTPEQVVDYIKSYKFQQPGYISLFGLYPLTESFQNKELQRAFNNSFLNPVHGKSIEIYLRLKYGAKTKTVDGIFLLDKLLNSELTHYFYGTKGETLEKIEERIVINYPKARIQGSKSPPYFEIGEIEKNISLENDFKDINQFSPNVIWVGLGGIKQDLVMYNYSEYCENSLMIGVGAVFDYFAGNLSLSPEVVKSSGLRWLYRGGIQPKTLRRSYKAIKNILFS